MKTIIKYLQIHIFKYGKYWNEHHNSYIIESWLKSDSDKEIAYICHPDQLEQIKKALGCKK